MYTTKIVCSRRNPLTYSTEIKTCQMNITANEELNSNRLSPSKEPPELLTKPIDNKFIVASLNQPYGTTIKDLVSVTKP